MGHEDQSDDEQMSWGHDVVRPGRQRVQYIVQIRALFAQRDLVATAKTEYLVGTETERLGQARSLTIA